MAIKSEWILFILGFATAVLCFSLFATFQTYQVNDRTIIANTLIESYDTLGRVSCESQSMGLMLDCKSTTLYYKQLRPEDPVYEGRVYLYEKDADTLVIHRLMGSIGLDNEQYIFKGDANEYYDDELVNRSQILYELKAITYSYEDTQ